MTRGFKVTVLLWLVEALSGLASGGTETELLGAHWTERHGSGIGLGETGVGALVTGAGAGAGEVGNETLGDEDVVKVARRVADAVVELGTPFAR
ncbi:MAG: hypothetical protein EBS38_07035, partial [Actinobacteria bacterium]|nr:hypothetical protein [Actinomycetota bacterium]